MRNIRIAVMAILAVVLFGAALAAQPNPKYKELFRRRAELGREINGIANKLAGIDAKWSAQLKSHTSQGYAAIDASNASGWDKFGAKIEVSLIASIGDGICKALELAAAGVSQEELDARIKEFDEVNYELTVTPALLDD
jgi:hypothetical protein